MTPPKVTRRRIWKSVFGFAYLVLAILLLVLQGCAGIPAQSFAPPTSNLLSTPIPPYVATEQASAMRARSTIQAGEAQAYNLALTGTAVAMDVNQQATQVALYLAQSAATEQYFIRQTQLANEMTVTAGQAALIGTATAGAMAAEATATARSWEATSAAGTEQAISTSTAQAATATQVEADNRIQATATQLAINEMIRRDESQRQTLLFRTWALRLALVLVFVFCLVLIWKATPWLLLKFFGFQSWNGKPIVVVPDARGGFKVVDIARSMGPGLTIDENGNMVTTGLAPNLEMQNVITARAQAAELLLSFGALPTEMKKRILRQVVALSTPPEAPAMPMPSEIANVAFKVLPPTEGHVGEWLRDVEGRLLEDGEE